MKFMSNFTSAVNIQIKSKLLNQIKIEQYLEKVTSPPNSTVGMWGAKKYNLLKNTQRSIYAVKIYTKQYQYFSIINQS